MSSQNNQNKAGQQKNLAELETQLKVELLQTQVAKAKFDFAKAKRDDRAARREAGLKNRQLAAQVRKSELDLSNAERERSKALAEETEQCTVTFYDGVTDATCKDAISTLSRVSRRFPGQPLTIVLNSPGGSVLHGLALYDHIEELRRNGHHVTVKVRGMAASMGGILLQAGDKRVVGPEAMVLIHEVSAGTAGKVGEMEDRVAFSKLLWVKLSKILSKRSKMTADEIREKAHKYDWWLTAEEAVELGFADEIG